MISTFKVDQVIQELQALADSGVQVQVNDTVSVSPFSILGGKGFPLYQAYFFKSNTSDPKVIEEDDATAATKVKQAISELDAWLMQINPGDSDAAKRICQEKIALLLTDVDGCYATDHKHNRITLLQYAAQYGAYVPFSNPRGVRLGAFEEFLKALGPFVLRNPDPTSNDSDYLLTACKGNSEAVLIAFIRHYATELPKCFALSTKAGESKEVVNRAMAEKTEFDMRIVNAIQYVMQKQPKWIDHFLVHGEVEIYAGATRTNSKGPVTIKDYVASLIDPKGKKDAETTIASWKQKGYPACQIQGPLVIKDNKDKYFVNVDATKGRTPMQWAFVAAVVAVVCVAITEGAMWNTSSLNDFFKSMLDEGEGLSGENKLENGKKVGLFFASIAGVGMVAGGVAWGAAKMRR